MTIFDAALLGVLLLLLPGRALWRSFREEAARPEPVTAKYRRTLLLASALVGTLLLTWHESARPWALLGLDPPFGTAGLIRLGASVFLLTALAATARRRKAEVDPATMRRAEEMLPKTRGEVAAFLLVMLVVGAGWELLYRGFAIWALEPGLGTVRAVLVAGGAYAVSHGYRGRTQFIGAVAGALAFTLAYVLTRSLWWLMLLHMGLPLVGLMAHRAARPAHG
jgi:membrane protease YdiL (CAAX protease family)